MSKIDQDCQLQDDMQETLSERLNRTLNLDKGSNDGTDVSSNTAPEKHTETLHLKQESDQRQNFTCQNRGEQTNSTGENINGCISNDCNVVFSKEMMDSEFSHSENDKNSAINDKDYMEDSEEGTEKTDDTEVESDLTEQDNYKAKQDPVLAKEHDYSEDDVTENKGDNVFKTVDDEVVKEDDDTENIGEDAFQTDEGSEESDPDGEYESAEEGEEIQVDKQNLREMEETLTEEQKEERRNDAQQLKEEGNELFRDGSYKMAIRTYSRALRTCPLKYPKDRAIMYSNRAACKMRLEEFEDSVKDCTKALELHPHYMKALMRRAELYEKTEKLDEALADYQKILELDPSQHTARAACLKLPEQIKERNEKLKEEMMGKLKELGNMVLRPFGLSTNNFQMNQDPNTGGYSINFVQNPKPN